ncbi:MAG: type II secretion system protein [Candidatus Levybacteria bacterium]|nr:type II secretion system protein [Candidatus Levybacteria bacterium]
MKRGFTLIEVLVVLALLTTIGSLILSIITSMARTVSKTTAINRVTQNGSAAIIQITKTLRNAKSFNGISVDGSEYATDCSVSVLPLTPTPTPTEYHVVKIKDFTDKDIKFVCLEGILGIKEGDDIIQFVNESEVAVTSCSFTCSQASTFEPPTIGISFTLSQATEETLPERTVSPIPFQTTIRLRNVNR